MKVMNSDNSVCVCAHNSTRWRHFLDDDRATVVKFLLQVNYRNVYSKKYIQGIILISLCSNLSRLYLHVNF